MAFLIFLGPNLMTYIFFFLLKACVHAKLLQSCPILCHPMDCSLPGSSVHGVLQARILEWGCLALPQGIFPIQGSNLGLLPCRWILYPLSHLGSPQSIFTALKIHCTLLVHLSSSHPCPSPWQLLIFLLSPFPKCQIVGIYIM